jgi:hypothetical protein
MKDRIAEMGSYGFAHIEKSNVASSHLMCKQTKEMKSVRMLGVLLQNVAVHLLRLLQITSLMMLKGKGEEVR